MKRESILIALGMGFIIFAIRTQIKNESISNLFQLQLISLAGIAFGLKRNYSKIRLKTPEFKITFRNAFWLAIRMCFIASLFSSLFYFVIPINTFQVHESSKLIRSLDVLISTLFLGSILSAIYSWFVTYRQH